MSVRRSAQMFGHFVRAYPWRTGAALLALVVAGILEGLSLATLLPVISLAGGWEGGAVDSRLQQTVERAVAALGVTPSLGLLLGLVVGALVLKAAVSLISMRQVGYVVARVAADLRLALIRALLRARWSHFVSHPVGASANAIGTEAMRASEAYSFACLLVAMSLQVAVYVALALLVSWQLTLAAMLAGAAVGAVMWAFVRQARWAGAQQTRLLTTLLARLSDALTGVKPIKAMGRESLFATLLEGETAGLELAQRRQVMAREASRALREPVVAVLLAIGVAVAAAYGALSMPELVFFGLLFFQIARRLLEMQYFYLVMASFESAFWSMRAAIERAEQEREDSSGVQPPRLTSEIALRDVSFAYGDHRVLDRVSAAFPARTFTAICGPSGAGKTTLVDLIIGLHRPAAGEVTIDGVPLGELELVDLASLDRLRTAGGLFVPRHGGEQRDPGRSILCPSRGRGGAPRCRRLGVRGRSAGWPGYRRR